MLPPVDPNVLERNPNFEILYKDLCTRKLNPDGSSRDTKKQRIHDEIRRNLTTALTTHNTTTILHRTLSTLPSRSSTLPPDLHAATDIVTALLHGHIPSTDREILAADIAFFLDHVPIISEAISTQLTTTANLLCKIADPTNPPNVNELAQRAEGLKNAATRDLPHDLATSRIALANTAYTVLTTHLHLLSTSIRILEQTMHGSLSRATKAKAEYLHARATLLGLQAKMHTQTHAPPAEFVAALRNFRTEQGETERSLRDREELARQALELYDKAGEKAMRDIAKRAGVLRGEIGRTRGEVEKLERGE